MERGGVKGEAIGAVAKSLRIDTSTANTIIAAAGERLSRAIERNTLNRGGVADLVAALGSGHHARLSRARRRADGFAHHRRRQRNSRTYPRLEGCKPRDGCESRPRHRHGSGPRGKAAAGRGGASHGPAGE